MDDEEIAEVYILGYNRKLTDPGETATGSACVINGTYIPVKNMQQYELMEPDMVQVAYIGSDNRAYSFYYDFKTQSYTDTSNGGKDIDKWSKTDIGKKLPKPDARVIVITSDDEDYFGFETYGVSKEDYDSYIDLCKSEGFTEV